MKYAVIILDGAADRAIDELDGLTPLEASSTPHLDRLARSGRVGSVVTTPEGFDAGSDVCSMCLLGYDPRQYHTGRAPIEAAALGLRPATTDWIFRLNLVTVESPLEGGRGLMLDHSAGAIPEREARALVRDLETHWRSVLPEVASGLAITPGAGYRNILVDSSGRDYDRVDTVPPHEIPGEAWADHLPHGGEAGEALCRLMSAGAELLSGHEINRARVEQGLRPANMPWIWGQGRPGELPLFESRFGLRGAMITAVDLLAGIAALMGWDRLEVPGVAGYHGENDYGAQGRAAAEALDAYDVVCCHVETPDEASHQGDLKTKIEAIEASDEHVIGPVLERLEACGDPEADPEAEGWRVLVMPDHYTCVETRRHDPTPVPFAIAGAWVRSVVERGLTEREAAESDLQVDAGHDLMEYFLRSGLAGVRTRSRE